MKSEQRVIYIVYTKDDDGESWSEYAEIYDDGDVRCIWAQSDAGDLDESSDTHDRNLLAEADDLVEFSWKLSFKDYTEDAPVLLFDLMREKDGCPTHNEKYPEAYKMLCIITESAPPFDGYKIEYFGEGEPWERDPDWKPGTIYN